MIVVSDINDVVGRYVIATDRLAVKVLTKPRLERYEIVPGLIVDRWEALAIVNSSLCVVELSVAPTTDRII